MEDDDKMLISCMPGFEVDQKIKFIETKFNIKFSSEYKTFLNKYNGGYTPFSKITKGVKTDITGFYGFHNDGDLSFDKILDIIQTEELIEKGFFPIAENDYGDLFVIKVSDDDNGSIYFTYHDDDRNIKIADSFSSFIEMIKSKKIGKIRTIEERRKGLIEAGLQSALSEELVRSWQEEIDFFQSIKQEEVIL